MFHTGLGAMIAEPNAVAGSLAGKPNGSRTVTVTTVKPDDATGSQSG